MKFDYRTIRHLPPLIRTMTFAFDAWVVGGAAKYMVGLQQEVPRDYDVIVPIRNWTDAQHCIPYPSMSNTFGGFKVDGDDIWAEDLDHFLMTCTKGEDVIAVQPRKQLMVVLKV